MSNVRLGHWTHPSGVTGCTVLLADRLVPAAVEVRGAAPGTRETDLLATGCTVQGVDAVLLSGGSAFGLSAADGVMQWLHEHGRGFQTSAIPVPIVSGAVIFDLRRDEIVWPDSVAGYDAVSQSTNEWSGGRVGGGAGASVSKGYGRPHAIPAGVGVAQIAVPAGTLSAVFVVNAVGDIADDRTGSLITKPAGREHSTEDALLQREIASQSGENTVIGAIVCDRRLDSDALHRLAVAGHSGLSRVVRPSHTVGDGDTIFALATGDEAASAAGIMQLTVAAQIVAARAISNAVRHT